MSNWLLDLLFPPKCVFCGTLLRNPDSGYCLNCMEHLPETDQKKQILHTKGCVAPFRYEGDVREALLRYKFGNRPFYAAVFGPMIAEKLRQIDADFVTWIPVSRRRRFFGASVEGKDRGKTEYCLMKPRLTIRFFLHFRCLVI